jgi:hypothetical protein
MVRLQQGNMKHMMDFCGIYKFELEGHDIDLFHECLITTIFDL